MRWFAVLAAWLGCLLLPLAGVAEEGYAGTWKAGPSKIRVSVESWGEDCGRQPPAEATRPGGPVHIEQAGSELKLSGAMQWRTDHCYTRNQSARLVSSTAGDERWRVACRTPQDDPKAERGTYTLRATSPNRLSFREESRYDWQLKDSRCVATRISERTLTRETPVAEDTPAEQTPSGEGTEDRSTQCTPGEPHRLRLSPAKVALEPGQRVCFHARVRDADGCPVRDANVRFDLERPPSVEGRMRRHCFEAAATAAEAEGTFRVVARAGSLRDRATVVVRTADLSDLIARGSMGEDGPPDDAEAPAPEREEASRVAARSRGEGLELLWPLVGAGAALAVLLAVAAVLVMRRRDRTEEAGATRSSDAPAQGTMPVASARPPTPSLRCPVCRRDYPPGTLFCPTDGAQLDEEPEAASEPPRQPMICPACRRGFAPEARYCPHDSEELMPYAAFVEQDKRGASEESAKARICPRCGERYGPEVAFCGKDGSELVLVN